MKYVDGKWIEDKCPFSKNGGCSACRVLNIGCDGERYHNCEQYLVKSGKKEHSEKP